MAGTQDASHIGQLGCVNRICGESGSLQRNKHIASLFYKPDQGVRMTMQEDLEYLLEDDGPPTHQYSNPKVAVNDREEHPSSKKQTCVLIR